MRWLIPLTVFLRCVTPAHAYVSPTGTVHVLRAFDRPEHDWLPGHRGVDLSLPVGGQVVAAGPGVVAFAGVVAGTIVTRQPRSASMRRIFCFMP